MASTKYSRLVGYRRGGGDENSDYGIKLNVLGGDTAVGILGTENGNLGANGEVGFSSVSGFVNRGGARKDNDFTATVG